MRCATHPDVETNLRCSKCDKPICPKCAIETPVGYRCRECARLSRLPTFRVAPRDILKATFAGLGAAIVCGILWMLIQVATPLISIFSIILAGAVGYLVGEAMSRSVNKKRGLVLKIIGGVMVLVSYTIANQLTFSGQFIAIFNFYNLIGIAAGIYVAVSRL